MRTLHVLLYGLLPALSGGVALTLLLDRARLIEGGMVYALVWLPPFILLGGFFCHTVGPDPHLRGLYQGYSPRRLLIRLLLWLTNDVPAHRARLNLSLGVWSLTGLGILVGRQDQDGAQVVAALLALVTAASAIFDVVVALTSAEKGLEKAAEPS